MFNYSVYLLMFAILTFISIYLRVKHKNHRLILWATMIIFCGGLVGLQVALEKTSIPYMIEHEVYEFLITPLTIFSTVLNAFINTFPYYGILVFFIIYNGWDSRQKWPLIALSLPLWFTLFFQTNVLRNHIEHDFIAIWGLCYLATTIGLAIRLIINEPRRKQRLNLVLSALIFLIPLSVLNIYHFSAQPFSNHLLVAIPIVFTMSLLLIFYLYLRDTFLGVKRQSVRIIHVGTGLIHHSLKNSIGKVKLNALIIQNKLNTGKYDEIEVYIDNLLNTHESMLETMSKISSAVSNRMEMKKEENDISFLLNEVTESMEAFPNIQVIKQYHPTRLSIDRKLITECLYNICNNAIDAMNEDGVLTIRLQTRKNKVLLMIRDTGCGMNPIQLQNIFEPFYSKKLGRGKHFGLGMFQVKKVMDGHKGKVEVRSIPKKGTSVVLTFRK